MIKECTTCTKQTEVKPSRVRAANYCSRACYWVSKKGKPATWLRGSNADEIRKRISTAKLGEKNAMYNLVGEKHHNWTGGKNMTLWKSVEYQRWRKSVFRRDNYTCQNCGDSKGGNLQADHIKPRYWYPELTFSIDNGRTLCKDCHMQTPTWGARVKKLVPVD